MIKFISGPLSKNSECMTKCCFDKLSILSDIDCSIYDKRQIPRLTITVKEFCQATGLGKTSCFKLIREGRLAKAIICGRSLITVESAKILIEQSLVKKGPV